MRHSMSWMLMLILSVLVSAALADCPPASLVPNPKPVTGQPGPECIVRSSWVHLSLGESWSRKVDLEQGKNYWFAASKCARGRHMTSEVRDAGGSVVASDSGYRISFCFTAPTTGKYTVSYRVTELNSSYTYAVTSSCLSKSNRSK